MKKTSRRRFGKELSGAIAATALTSLVANGEPLQDQKKPPVAPKQTHTFSHDTPPPTDITDGSLTIALDRQLNYAGASGTRHLYHKGFGVDARIAHIKVFKGNGDLLYQNLEADDSVVTIKLENAGLQEKGYVTISKATIQGHDVFQIDSDQQFPPTGNVLTGKRRHSYGHAGYGQNFRIKSIEVTKATDPPSRYVVTAPRDTSDSEEYRVMIWHEGD
jgi:hypothetical protein